MTNYSIRIVNKINKTNFKIDLNNLIQTWIKMTNN